MSTLWTRDNGFGATRRPTPAPVRPAPSNPAATLRVVPSPPPAPAALAVDAMLEEMERLPAARPAVLRVLQLVDDPDASSQQLATAAGADMALTTKLLRLANSAYYGLGGRVTSLPFAITVVGFQTVRAIAVAAMTDLPHDAAQLPENFWTAAALTAVASGAVAGQVGARQPEAFCIGLLADLGCALLFRADPKTYAALPPAFPIKERLTAEAELFGTTHPRLAERVLKAWGLPSLLTSVIGAHHDPVSADGDPVRLAFAAGHEIAGRILDPEHDATSLAVLTRGAVAEDVAPGLIANVQRQAEPLVSCLTEDV